MLIAQPRSNKRVRSESTATDRLSPSRQLIRDTLESSMRERWVHSHLPDLHPTEVRAAMFAPTTPLVGRRATLARLMGTPLSQPASDQQPDLSFGSRGYPGNLARIDAANGGLWAGKVRENGASTAKSDREPEKQWWDDPDEEMVITWEGSSSDHYHEWHDWGREYDDRHDPFRGNEYLGLGVGQDEEEDEDGDEPDEESEDSIELNGSDLSRTQQQDCFVQRMGFWEEDVDWNEWWNTIVDTVFPPIPEPGPDDLVWHSPGSNTPMGYFTYFTLCGNTVVFIRRLRILPRSSYREARVGVWEVWAYRSPDCTSEGLSEAWMDRKC